MVRDACERCRFWRRTEGAVGQCRRRAPVPQALLGDDADALDHRLAVLWPPTAEGEWCGEFQPLALVQPAPTRKEAEA